MGKIWKTIMMMAIATSGICVNAAEASPKSMKDSVNCLHQMLWTRMIDRNSGVMFDYSDLDGKVEIPTPEECLAGKPNALSWWTPIENGAFFNGLYIDALCNRWLAEKDPETKKEAKMLADGLLLLQKVGKRPGFIARGVSTDGRTHYPIGSDDQTFPWFYGLWKYIHSGIPSQEEKRNIQEKMIEVATALQQQHWRMPCEEPYLVRGSWNSEDLSHAVRIVFVSQIMFELTGDKKWSKSLDDVITFRFKSGRSRLDVIANGCPEMRIDQTWIFASSIAALRELWRMEKDNNRRKKYKESLSKVGATAAPFIAFYSKFKDNSNVKYRGNWRVMNQIYRPQPKVKDAVELAMDQVKLWNADSPRISREKRFVMLPLFSAWIVLLSEDDALIKKKMPMIQTVMGYYPWAKLHLSACFVGENIYSEIITRKLSEKTNQKEQDNHKGI